MDLYNLKIISFKASIKSTLDHTIDPLIEALSYIKKNAIYRTIIHSDQGWQYQHLSLVNELKRHKVFQSMSRKGNCLDNSLMENYFGLLKQEMYYGEDRVSYATLKKIDEYIYFYNNDRIKEKLSGLSPAAYQNKTLN